MPESVFGRQAEGHVRIAYTQPPHRLRTAFDRMRLFLEELR